MLSPSMINKVNSDKHLYMLPDYPVITIYDDNFFVRNDYDVLSLGQRNYLVAFFNQFGFTQTSGKQVTDGNITLHFPKPKHTLALSSFEPKFAGKASADYYAITPSTFAEVLFYQANDKGEEWAIEQVKHLIQTCPYNIELVRDTNYRTPIEAITKRSFGLLTKFQQQVVEEKFKFKKALWLLSPAIPHFTKKNDRAITPYLLLREFYE